MGAEKFHKFVTGPAIKKSIDAWWDTKNGVQLQKQMGNWKTYSRHGPCYVLGGRYGDRPHGCTRGRSTERH